MHNQPWALLEQRAKKGLVYDHFHANPEKYRLHLVELDLDVRQVTPWEEKVQGVDEQLTEVYGVLPESGNRIFVAVVIDWPPDMPVGNVWGKARIAGYFFKMQGYEPGGARPNARALTAPLIIGRIQWQPAVLPPVQSSDWTWMIVGGAAVIAAAVGVAFLTMRRKQSWVTPPMTISRNPDTPTLEDWLDGRGHGGEVLLGNNFAGNGESSNGESNHRGTGQGDPPVPPGDFGRMQ